MFPWIVWGVVEYREWRKEKKSGETNRSYISWHNERKLRPWFGKEPFKQGLISGLGYFILWVIWAGFVSLIFE